METNVEVGTFDDNPQTSSKTRKSAVLDDNVHERFESRSENDRRLVGVTKSTSLMTNEVLVGGDVGDHSLRRTGTRRRTASDESGGIVESLGCTT